MKKEIQLFAFALIFLFSVSYKSSASSFEYKQFEFVKDTLPSNIENGELFTSADEVPEFTGGSGEMWKYLSSNIKYPTSAAEDKVQGRVLVKFVVAKDGQIQTPEILEGVDPRLDQEALRVVKSMPNWVPGKIEGQPVNVQIVMPVLFRL